MVVLGRGAGTAHLDGHAPIRPLDTGPLEVPEVLDEVDIGHRSLAVDRILVDALAHDPTAWKSLDAAMEVVEKARLREEYDELVVAALALGGRAVSLTPREERVLRMRFGIGMNTDHTLEEVGQQFSVTREPLQP